MFRPIATTICALSFLAGITTAAPLAQHVIVIGVDGLSPEGIHLTDTPNIDRLLRQGSHTWQARAVMPTSSSPNWASMISGAGPEQHGVTSNKMGIGQLHHRTNGAWTRRDLPHHL